MGTALTLNLSWQTPTPSAPRWSAHDAQTHPAPRWHTAKGLQTAHPRSCAIAGSVISTLTSSPFPRGCFSLSPRAASPTPARGDHFQGVPKGDKRGGMGTTMLPAAHLHCSGPDLLWKRPSRGEQGGEEGTNLLFHQAEAQQGPHDRFCKHGVTSWSPGDAEGPGEVSALTRADGSIWSSSGSSDYSGDATSPSSPSPACCVSCQQGTVTLGSPRGTPAHRGPAQTHTGA